MINVTGLSKRYGNSKKYALKNFNLNLNKGEILCIMGPNGSGKTTMINTLLGIIDETSGIIKIDSKSLKEIDIKNYIAYIPDDTILIEELTGTEYVDFIGSLYNTDYKERATKLINLFDMKDNMKYLISSYSHGMKKKLQIIVAFMLNRPIIIMDEPFRGLDIEAILILEKLIDSYIDKNKSILIATHDTKLAETIADKIIILFKGEIFESDSLKNIKTKYQNMKLSEIFISKVFKERRINTIEDDIRYI